MCSVRQEDVRDTRGNTGGQPGNTKGTTGRPEDHQEKSRRRLGKPERHQRNEEEDQVNTRKITKDNVTMQKNISETSERQK